MADCKRKEIPFTYFPLDITFKLMDILTIENSLLENWSSLLGLLGMTVKEYTTLKREFQYENKNPVLTLVEYYSTVPGATVEKFLEILNQLKSRSDLKSIKEEIKVFVEKHHSQASERICTPTENDETLSELKASYCIEQERYLHSSNSRHYIGINSIYPHSRINTTTENYIKSNNIFEDYENSNDNFQCWQTNLPGELVSKGVTLENDENVNDLFSVPSISLNSFPSGQKNNLSTSYMPNFPRQIKHERVNILPECRPPVVINIDSTKLQNTDKIDSSTSQHSDIINPLASLIPLSVKPEYGQISSSRPDSMRKIFISYANDSKTRAKQLAKFFRQPKYNLKITLVEDFSERMSHNFRKWVDYNVEMADIVINIISPQYKQDVDSFTINDDSNLLVRYIADQLQNQYYNNGCKHIKARVIIFETHYKRYIPEFLKSTIPFEYRKEEEWRQFCFMVIGQHS